MEPSTKAAVIVVVCALAAGCAPQSGTDVPAPNPTTSADAVGNTVRRYFNAYNAGDVDGMNDTSCSSAQRTEATAPPFATVVSDIAPPTVTGESATVLVTMSIDSGTTTAAPSRIPIYLINEAGHWGVCMFERASNS